MFSREGEVFTICNMQNHGYFAERYENYILLSYRKLL